MPVADALFLSAELVLRELALFAAVGFLIGGIGDVAIDIGWLALQSRRLRDPAANRERALASHGPPRRHGRLAIFVPAWDEADVIGAMLANTVRSFAGQDYMLFVGCYPNDPGTEVEIRKVAVRAPAVRLVRCPRPGPTTKADCLNALWWALQAEEARSGRRFKAVVLHDAEDVVHPEEPPLFDRLIEDHALVQIPVRPLVDRGSRWIAGHYCDEFAESHTKNLVVRSAIGAGVPSSGVGCAIDRAMLGAIAEERGGLPFDDDSLTEDYEIGLRIAERGGRGIFVRLRDEDGELIAVRAHFPSDLSCAVRQKTRWIRGIALAGWDRLGWTRGIAESWMRLHDRRAILAAIVLFAAYMALLLGGLVLVAAEAGGYPPAPLPPAFLVLLKVNLAIMAWRLAMRALFTGLAYGPAEALRAIPRALFSNVIAMMAARRALTGYLFARPGAAPRWDKTRHVFPEDLAAR